jgi:hypothetical protein
MQFQYLKIGQAKMPLLLAGAFFVAFYLIIKRIQKERPEGTTEPTTNGDGNYSYTGVGRPETRNFKSDAFDCHDGSKVPVSFYGNLQFLMSQLEVLQARLKTSIHINSGYRTAAYNSRLNGSAKNSQHLVAKAADITAIGYSPSTLHRKIEELISKGELYNGGLGLYSGFVHYDVRATPARWNG